MKCFIETAVTMSIVSVTLYFIGWLMLSFVNWEIAPFSGELFRIFLFSGFMGGILFYFMEGGPNDCR